MFLKSIRWRLQLWYGVLLVAVLAGFAFTACQFERARQFRGIDEELHQRNSVLLATLVRPAMREGLAGRFSEGPPPREGRLPDGPPDDPPPGPPQSLGQFKLNAQQAALFDNGALSAFYYVIWRRDGKELARSVNSPGDIPLPIRGGAAADVEIMRERGAIREAIHFTPMGECVLSGRSIAVDLADMRRFAWWLGAIGGAVLLCGLAGGWFLATRAIRPIEDISSTAVKIAAGDLSQRIDATDTDNELGRLAGDLNSTFARLEKSFAQQAQFTADAAHELRTPVSVILAQTQTALKYERDAVDYRRTVEACQRAAQRMRGLIESLLELARLDAGQEPMKKMRFDLAETVRDCVELVRPLAQERHIKIHTDLSALEWTGDMERLAQVITNLLTNAIHYNKDGGEVRVNAGRQKHEAVITVADTGQGIAAEELPRIFERFYRADKSRSKAAGRTGLGLAISKAIVEAHGGGLEVSSQLGTGTIFVLHLPERD